MKSITLLPAIATSLALLASTGCRPEKTAAASSAFNVRTVTIQPPGAIQRETGPAFLGLIRGDTETSLSFKVSGQLVRIGPRNGNTDWTEGVTVEAGADLAQLDTANFVSAISAARARAELARANFARN